MNYKILRLHLLNQANVVALQHNSTECLPLVDVLHVVFFGLVQHQIHVLIEANDGTLNAKVDILKDPYADARSILEVAENQVDGLDHH